MLIFNYLKKKKVIWGSSGFKASGKEGKNVVFPSFLE